MSKRKLIELASNELTKTLVDRGKLIEAGFVLFAHYVIPKNASPEQLTEMRLAWMAGAEYLFSSIMNFLEEGEEPTENDLRRMNQIQTEINEWRGKLSERVLPAQGRG